MASPTDTLDDLIQAVEAAKQENNGALEEFARIVDSVKPVSNPNWKKVAKVWNERVEAKLSNIILADGDVALRFLDYVQHMFRKKPSGKATIDKWLYDWKVIFQKLQGQTATQHFASDDGEDRSDDASDDDVQSADTATDLPDMSQPSASHSTLSFGPSSPSFNVSISSSGQSRSGIGRMFNSDAPAVSITANLSSTNTASTVSTSSSVKSPAAASARSGTNWPASGRPNTPVFSLRSQPKLPQGASKDPKKRGSKNLILTTMLLHSLKECKADKETAKLSELLERVLDKTLKTEDVSVNAGKQVSTASTMRSAQASQHFITREIHT
eukprot:g37822.t1